MQSRLIMVEGNPFTGKSTTSEFIAQQLTLNGYETRWLSEGMMLYDYFPHVVATLDKEREVSEALLLDEWRAFVQAILAESAIFVVDSALSYSGLYPLHAVDRPIPHILAELRRIAELCAPLQPRVIHLTGDSDRLARDSIAERGPEWEEHLIRQAEAAPYQQARGRTGLEGVIAQLQETQALMGQVLADGGWQAITLDVTGTDRRSNERTILDFLGVPEVIVERPDLPLEVLRSYAGSYTTEDPERPNKVLMIQLEGDTLALHNPRSRYGPLVPLTETRFHVRATTIDLEFVVAEGEVRRMLILGSDGKMHPYERA